MRVTAWTGLGKPWHIQKAQPSLSVIQKCIKKLWNRLFLRLMIRLEFASMAKTWEVDSHKIDTICYNNGLMRETIILPQHSAP